MVNRKLQCRWQSANYMETRRAVPGGWMVDGEWLADSQKVGSARDTDTAPNTFVK